MGGPFIKKGTARLYAKYSTVLTKEPHDLVWRDAKELPPRALAVRCEPHMDRTLDCECVYEPERALELVR